MLFWSLSLVVLTTNCLAVDVRPKQSERSVRIAKPDTNKPIVFPTDDDAPTAARTAAVSQPNYEPIPENVLIRMKNIQTADDFLNFLGPQESTYGGQNPRPLSGNPEERVPINGSDVNNTSPGIIGRKGMNKGLAQAAGCEVEMKPVELEKPSDPSIIIWPSCTRLPRCGGCCSSSLLECVPIKTNKTEINVIKAKYKGKSSGKFDVLGTMKVKIEHHLKCECQCVQKAEHCTRLQTYKQEECKCACTNVLMMKSCTGSDHFWDPKDCQCKCREILECSTGFYYSMDSCKCEVFRLSRIGGRRFPGTNRSVTVQTTTPRALAGHLGGDFGAPLAHLSGGERSKFASESNVNIKPYDAEPFTLAQTGRAKKGRPVVRVDSSRSTDSKSEQPRV